MQHLIKHWIGRAANTQNMRTTPRKDIDILSIHFAGLPSQQYQIWACRTLVRPTLDILVQYTTVNQRFMQQTELIAHARDHIENRAKSLENDVMQLT